MKPIFSKLTLILLLLLAFFAFTISVLQLTDMIESKQSITWVSIRVFINLFLIGWWSYNLYQLKKMNKRNVKNSPSKITISGDIRMPEFPQFPEFPSMPENTVFHHVITTYETSGTEQTENSPKEINKLKVDEEE